MVLDRAMNLLSRIAVVLAVMSWMVVPGFSAAPGSKPEATSFWVYVGTYTGQKSKGIYLSRLDTATGKLEVPVLAAETQNPTFLAVHPRVPALFSVHGPLLFAANEVGGGGKSGAVSAYSADGATGKLVFLNQQSSRGGGPCHLSVDPSGRFVLVANYGSGSIAALPIQPDGHLSPATSFIQHAGSSVNNRRQEGPHAHWIDSAPGSQLAFACDLGLDKVMVYRFDPTAGSLTPHDPSFVAIKAGSGPRHLAFHPDGRFAYLINELGNTMVAFAYDRTKGSLAELQSLSTLPGGFAGQNSTAEVEAHPSGRFLYGSNRGHDSIVVYAIAPQTGTLTLLEHQSTRGKTPRNFAVDPTGQWLLAANQGSDTVVVFRIDSQTGRLTPSDQTLSVGAPVCLKFLPVQ
jgi:6-phosphogluconolactonase